MVKQSKKDKKMVFVCEACGFLFAEKKWATKCEDWCNEHKSCNLDIAKHAIA